MNVVLNGRLLGLNKDYYKILGVSKEASADEMKSSFRSLSKKHHPDVGGDEEKFKEINEAYSVLSDPQKKQEYDNPGLSNGLGGFPFGFNPFESFGFSNRRRPDPTAPRPGGNIELIKELPLHVFIFGGDIKIKLSYNDFCKECGGKGAMKTEQCSNCGGSGMIAMVQTAQGMQIHTSSPCPKCNGGGWTSVEDCESCSGTGKTKIEDRVVNVFVPFGIRDGHVLVKPGEGRFGFNGGPPGNLIIKLSMKLPRKDELTEEQIKILEEL
jgi:molecular chaperone DnaJ